MDINLHEVANALTNGQFFLEYLPIMSLEGRACVGAEALIRWRRQSKIVQPMDFIPAMENTPVSGLVTYWVIETVAHELGNWLRDTERVFISINVPPEILGRSGVYYAMSKCGLLDVLDKLVMEVTERGAPDNLGLQALHESNRWGLKVCLDDVGISNENLVLLIRANVDMVKVDKSFADRILEPNWSLAAMKGLATFVQSTAVQVIAEGIETEFQSKAFQAAGIQMGQGWYFSHPLCAAELIEFFRAHKGFA